MRLSDRLVHGFSLLLSMLVAPANARNWIKVIADSSFAEDRPFNTYSLKCDNGFSVSLFQTREPEIWQNVDLGITVVAPEKTAGRKSRYDLMVHYDKHIGERLCTNYNDGSRFDVTQLAYQYTCLSNQTIHFNWLSQRNLLQAFDGTSYRLEGISNYTALKYRAKTRIYPPKFADQAMQRVVAALSERYYCNSVQAAVCPVSSFIASSELSVKPYLDHGENTQYTLSCTSGPTVIYERYMLNASSDQVWQRVVDGDRLKAKPRRVVVNRSPVETQTIVCGLYPKYAAYLPDGGCVTIKSQNGLYSKAFFDRTIGEPFCANLNRVAYFLNIRAGLLVITILLLGYLLAPPRRDRLLQIPLPQDRPARRIGFDLIGYTAVPTNQAGHAYDIKDPLLTEKIQQAQQKLQQVGLDGIDLNGVEGASVIERLIHVAETQGVDLERIAALKEYECDFSLVTPRFPVSVRNKRRVYNASDLLASLSRNQKLIAEFRDQEHPNPVIVVRNFAVENAVIDILIAAIQQQLENSRLLKPS